MSLVSSLAFLLRSAALCFLFTTAASAHLSVPFTRQRNTARSLDGSSATVPVTTASGHSFVVNVKVGTPPQSLSLLLSPSSPHTWVPNAEAMPCMTGHDPLEGFHSADDGSTGTSSACYLGVFSASKSSTAKMAEQIFLDFVVAYTDTINVSGVNMTDKFVLGDIELDDLPMGLVTSTSNQQWIGMLGLGNDATTNFPRPSSKYRPNFMDRLVSSGKIVTQAYSIWLNDAEGKSGNLLLGAIDKSRYEGDLVRLHAAKDPYDVFPSAFRVPLTSVNIDGDGANFKYSEPPIVASLSPAETFSYLPDGLAEGIMTASGATWNTTLQRATIACDAGSKKSKTSLRFQLEGPNGPVLNVRVADLVIPEHVSRWELAYDSLATLNRNACLFGIQKYPSLRDSSTPQYNLGSSLLRRTYLVFDAANKDVALAPVPSNTKTTSAIVPFENLGARIPSSRFYCVGDDFSCSEPNGDSGGTTSSPETSNNDAEQKNDNWKKIVIGVVVPVGLLAILAPIIYVLITRRRKRSRGKLLSAGPTLRKETESTDEVNSFRDDEYGVKVTVSVTGKVEMRKGPLPSPGLYPSSGLCPSPGLSPSQYWGDGVLRATSSGGASGKSGESEGWKEVYNVGK